MARPNKDLIDPGLKPCSKCGGNVEQNYQKPVYAKRGMRCRKCRSAQGAAQRKANPETYRAADARWKAAHPERRYEVTRLAGWRRLGLTFSLAQYASLLAEQAGRCAICRTDKPGRRPFHLDHDHTSGSVRGPLCARCNHGLGLLRDSPALLRAAAEYIESHQPQAELDVRRKASGR